MSVSSPQTGQDTQWSGRVTRDLQGYVEQRSLNEGCIEIAPLFFRVSPTKGLFPIQDTRSLDNTCRDLKGAQWGRDQSNKTHHPAPPTAKLHNTPDSLNSLCGMYMHIQQQSSHMHAHTIKTHGVGLFQWFDRGNHDIIMSPSHLAIKPQ